MMKKQTVVYFTLFALVGLTTTQAQTQLHVTNGCNAYGEETETDYYQFEPNNESRQIVNELLQGSGLSGSSFRLKESNCSNALAITVDGVRYILYNPDFLRKFKQDANTKWAAYGILAHEIGHHLNGHNLSETSPSVRKQYELEADRFAGNLLFRLRATVDEAQMFIRTIPLEGETKTHPPKSARLVATTNGWTSAYDLNRGIQPKAVEPPSVGNQESAIEWFNKGIKAENDKNWNSALDYYSRAIRLKPDDAEAYIGRGNAKNNLGQYRESIQDYDESIRLKPDNAEAFYNRGLPKYKLGQYREAIQDFDKAIRLKPDYANAYIGRGNAKDDLGQHREAIQDFDEAIRLKPDDADAFYNRGFAKNNLGQYREAIQDYDKAIRLKPDDASAFNNRGVAKDKLGQYREAIQDYDEAIRLNPNNASAFNNRAIARKALAEKRN